MAAAAYLICVGACDDEAGLADAASTSRVDADADSGGSHVPAPAPPKDAGSASSDASEDASSLSDAGAAVDAQRADALAPSCQSGEMACGDACIPRIEPAAAALYERVFSRSCALSESCHRGPTAKEGLDLSSLAALGNLGRSSAQRPGIPLVSPGQPDRSYLLAKLAGEGLADVSTTGQPTTVMPPPPGDPLCTEKIAVVAQWIEEAARVSLIDHEQWRVVDATEDPFPDRPANVTCPSTAGGREDLAGEPAFSVHTSECDYLTVSQPALVDLRAGDVVQLRIWQAELTAPETSEAHLAIAFGNEAIWEERVPIPSSARLISASFAVEEDRDGATPVYWHVHNHGDNEYALIELSVGPPQ